VVQWKMHIHYGWVGDKIKRLSFIWLPIKFLLGGLQYFCWKLETN